MGISKAGSNANSKAITNAILQTDPRQPSLHNPERGPNESFDDYKQRRRASNQAARNLRQPAQQFQFTQHTNAKQRAHAAKVREERKTGACPVFSKVRRHKRADPIKPTWPRTKDQRKQSRPMLYLSPLAELRRRLTLGTDDKGFPIMHKDWAGLTRAASQGRGDVLRAYLQRQA